MQTADYQEKPTPARSLHTPPTETTVPALLTKAWLCDHFGIPHYGHGKRRLRTHVLTDDILRECGIPVHEYRSIRIFTATQSIMLKTIFRL